VPIVRSSLMRSSPRDPLSLKAFAESAERQSSAEAGHVASAPGSRAILVGASAPASPARPEKLDIDLLPCAHLVIEFLTNRQRSAAAENAAHAPISNAPG
jgi:hypothetical protein